MSVLRSFLAALVVLVAAASLFILQQVGTSPLRVTIANESGEAVVVLRSGHTGLAGLDAALARSGHPDALVAEADGVWVLSRPVEVDPGAGLTVRDAELRLTSTADRVVRIDARGDLRLRRAKVTSWDPDLGMPDYDLEDGRAFVIARSGARLDVIDSTVTMLGHAAFGESGIVWRGRDTTGRVSGSKFMSNQTGAYVHDAEGVVVETSVFQGSLGDGLVLRTGASRARVEDSAFLGNARSGIVVAVASSGARIRGNEVAGNAEHGIAVLSGSDDVAIDGNEVRDNGKDGIVVGASARARLLDNEVRGNRTGISLSEGSRGAFLDKNTVTANRGDGVRVTSSRTEVALRGNAVTANTGPGLFIDDGSVALGADNRLAANRVGIEVDDDEPDVRVTDSVIEHNWTDGLKVRRMAGITVEGNLFFGNGKAAVSVVDPAGVASLLEENEIGPHPSGASRQRGADS